MVRAKYRTDSITAFLAEHLTDDMSIPICSESRELNYAVLFVRIFEGLALKFNFE